MAINGEIPRDCEVSNDKSGPWTPIEKLKAIQFAAEAPPRNLQFAAVPRPPKSNPTIGNFTKLACQQFALESGLTIEQVEHLMAVELQIQKELRATDQIEASLSLLLFGD